MTWRRRLKPWAGKLGITSADLWHGIALKVYRRKRLHDVAYREWLAGSGGRWISDHWGTLAINDQFTWEHTASQMYELTRLLKSRLAKVDRGGLVVDAGASDGSFLSLLGVQRGVGVNFLKACAKKIASDGHPAVLADIERLPFRDSAAQHVVCCETLEHVPNPIGTLNELGRICRGRIHLSIPWLSRTRLTGRPQGWPEVESHIFEFSEADFRKIVTHTGLTVTFSSIVQVFPEPRNPLTRWWLEQWMYPSYFPRLQYYELEPLASARTGTRP